MFTLAELQSAWIKVEDNAGCAGVDGVTVSRFAERADTELGELVRQLADSTYRPLPWLKVQVEKHPGSGEARTFLIPTVRDRIVQTALTEQLRAPLEAEFFDASFAYRPGRSVDTAVARIIQLRDRGFREVVHADIDGFFDHIDHAKLLALCQSDSATAPYLPLLRLWLRAATWDGDQLILARRGIAQGSPLSPLLSNFFLEPFDTAVASDGEHLVRYGDDFLILCAGKDDAAQAALRAGNVLNSMGLALNQKKTKITSFVEGFHFLGVFFLADAVYRPWKSSKGPIKVLAHARPMPLAQMQKYLQKRSGRPFTPPRPVRSRHPGPQRSKQESEVAFLYLTEQRSIVRKSGDRILVEREGTILLDVPAHKVERLLLFGDVQVTSAAMTELLEHRVTMSLFTRHGHYRGGLVPPASKNVPLRLAQFDLFRDAGATFSLAKRIVRGKLLGAEQVLTGLEKHTSGITVTGEIQQIRQALETLDAAELVQSLDGIEGAAARQYFTALFQFNRSTFLWSGRLQHPATDPINALLSLTYTMLTHEIEGLLEGGGLDPYLGFLHQLDYGRPSLALDLVEAFRHPVADRFVLSLLNQGYFAQNDFRHVPGEKGLYLQSESLKRFFQAYEQWMLATPGDRTSFRRSLQMEVEGLARHVRDRSGWTPFCAAGPEHGLEAQ